MSREQRGDGKLHEPVGTALRKTDAPTSDAPGKRTLTESLQPRTPGAITSAARSGQPTPPTPPPAPPRLGHPTTGASDPRPRVPRSIESLFYQPTSASIPGDTRSRLGPSSTHTIVQRASATDGIRRSSPDAPAQTSSADRAADSAEPSARAPEHPRAAVPAAVAPAPSAARAWPVTAAPRRLQLLTTEVGAVSPPSTITLTHHGSAPTDIAALEIILYGGTAEPAHPGEFELLQPQPRHLPPHQALTLEVVFRPQRLVPHIGARLRARGREPHEQIDVRLHAIPAPPRADHADQRELSVAQHEARRLEITAAPSVAHYGDMLATVLAAQHLTDRAPTDPEARARVIRLLEPVAHRLDQLNDHQGRLARFGAGNLAGQTALDISQTAIRSWLQRLRLGARIHTDELVARFRAGDEPIRFLTGERTDAPTLRTFHHATRVTGIGAAAMVLAPALLPIVAQEAPLLAFAGRIAARPVVLWALRNPAAALAASEALLGLGIQIGQDGWEPFWNQLGDPRGRWFLLAQVLMDYMHVKSGMHPGAASSDPPSPRPFSPGGAKPAPPPHAPPDISGARGRTAKLRAVVQQVHDAATAATGGARTHAPQRPRDQPAKSLADARERAARAAVHNELLDSTAHGSPTQPATRGRPWHTGAERGLAASEATIRAETVEMEQHPRYQARMHKARAKGFNVVMTSGDPHVEVIEVVDPQGKQLALRRTLYLRPRMRFLDLEHEMGHIEQLDRFAELPPTRRVIRTPSGEKEAPGNQRQGILTREQNIITEYHNRLSEFARLCSSTTPEVLAKELQGIETWRIAAENKAGLGRGDNTITRWAQQHFSEIPHLEEQIKVAGFNLRPRTRRW